MASAAPLAGALLLAACAASPRAADPSAVAPAGAPSTSSYVFTCDGNVRFAVRYDRAPAGATAAPAATLRLPESITDREVRLTPDPAASGARYRGRDAAGEVVFWEHQGQATLTMTGAPDRTCRPQEAATPWDESRLLGAEYRAVGQEPGWTLEVDEGRRMAFVGDYGNTRVVTPAPPPVTTAAGGPPNANRITYTARTEAHALTLEVVRQECHDAMSGASYPTTAVVKLDGREYRGCGRWLGGEQR